MSTEVEDMYRQTRGRGRDVVEKFTLQVLETELRVNRGAIALLASA